MTPTPKPDLKKLKTQKSGIRRKSKIDPKEIPTETDEKKEEKNALTSDEGEPYEGIGRSYDPGQGETPLGIEELLEVVCFLNHNKIRFKGAVD